VAGCWDRFGKQAFFVDAYGRMHTVIAGKDGGPLRPQATRTAGANPVPVTTGSRGSRSADGTAGSGAPTSMPAVRFG
jgi:hypothetical protein